MFAARYKLNLNSGRCRIWNHIPSKYPSRLHKTGNHNTYKPYQQISLRGQRLHSAFNGTHEGLLSFENYPTSCRTWEFIKAVATAHQLPLLQLRKIYTHPSNIKDKNPRFAKEATRKRNIKWMSLSEMVNSNSSILDLKYVKWNFRGILVSYNNVKFHNTGFNVYHYTTLT